MIVEGKDVNKERSLFLLLEGNVQLTIAGRPDTTMVRGNFLGAARFVEEETLRAMQALRTTPLYEAFSRADGDSSGRVDAQELVTAFKTLGVDITKAQAKLVIEMIDQDSDGECDLPARKK